MKEPGELSDQDLLYPAGLTEIEIDLETNVTGDGHAGRRLEVQYKVVFILVRTEAFNAVDELGICVEEMRLGDETRNAAIATANVEHAVAKARSLAEAFVVGIERRVVEDVLGQMEVVDVYVIYFVIPQVDEMI